MIAHLWAIEARIKDVLGENTRVVIGDATGVQVPYVVLWSGVGERPRELSFGGARGAFEEQVNVTCSAATSTAAMGLASAVREALTPGLDPAVLPGVPGRYVTLSHFDSRPVQVDRTVTATSTGVHPAFGVEIFDLDSQHA